MNKDRKSSFCFMFCRNEMVGEDSLTFVWLILDIFYALEGSTKIFQGRLIMKWWNGKLITGNISGNIIRFTDESRWTGKNN